MRGKNGPSHFTLTQMPRQQIGEIDEILAGLVGLGFRGRRSTSYLSRGSVFPSEYVPPSDSRVSPLAPLSALARPPSQAEPRKPRRGRKRRLPAGRHTCRRRRVASTRSSRRIKNMDDTPYIVGILNLALALV